MKIHLDLVRGILLGVCIACFAGCGGGNGDMVPVSGKITFDGGECPAPGSIIFSPIETENGASKRPGMAQFGTDGKFIVTSFEPGDGLVRGRYRVLIECNRGLPAPVEGGMDEVTYVSLDFQAPELIVSSDTPSIVTDYDVPLKK